MAGAGHLKRTCLVWSCLVLFGPACQSWLPNTTVVFSAGATTRTYHIVACKALLLLHSKDEEYNVMGHSNVDRQADQQRYAKKFAKQHPIEPSPFCEWPGGRPHRNKQQA